MKILDLEMIREHRIRNEFKFLRLYLYVSLDQRNFLDALSDVDRIFLYRGPILDFWCECGESPVAIIQNIPLHKIGHYLELSDVDIRAIEFSAEVEAPIP